MKASSQPVVVLGAGPAGLAAAFELVCHEQSVQVYERASYVGGLSRTVSRDGFRFDIGGHRWFTKNDDLNRLFVSLLGDEVVRVHRTSRIYFDGRYVEYPLRIADVLKNIGFTMSVRALTDYGLASLFPPASDRERSMEEAYVAQFGRTLYERFFRDYSMKVWGADCKVLSGDWVVQRSQGMSLFDSIKNAIRPAKERTQSLVENFMYPRNGYGRLSDRLREETEAGGGSVSLNSRVSAVYHKNGRVEAVGISDQDGNESLVDAAHLVSSIPMPALVGLMRPAAPQHVIAASKRLTFRDLITVNVMLRREQVTQDTWIYVHDPRLPFGRLHEPKNWSPAMVPDADHTSLVAELFCAVGDEIWSQSDEALCDLTVNHLVHTLGFIRPEEVVGAFAVRSPRAYPTYHLGYKEPLGVLKDYARQFGNLQLIGRSGAFRYDNADHAIESGLLAARNVLGASYDLDSVNAAAEYLEMRKLSPNGAQTVAAPTRRRKPAAVAGPGQ